MYRLWTNQVEEIERAKAEGKIVVPRYNFDGYETCDYVDVFENEEERKAEDERLRKIDEEYRRKKEEYLEYLRNNY